MNIADLRKSYEKAELNEQASHADPLQQFDQWFKEALKAELPEPNAMTVATVASVMALGSGTWACRASPSHCSNCCSGSACEACSLSSAFS